MATINAINSNIPIEVTKGGTAATTLTGVLTGNGTSAVTANAVTQYGTVIAGASNAVSSVAPSATSGVPFISQGAAANPVYGTAVVAGGGTGVATLTAYGVLAAGTTATGAIQQVSGTGSLNEVLVSQGAGLLPVWAAVPATAGVTSIAGTANQWSVSAATGAVTGSIPSTFIAPGTIASTTTLTAGNLTTAGIVYNTTVTGLLTSHATTQYNVQIGNATGQLADVAPGATGIALISQGVAANPAFGTVAIAGGGTNATSMATTFGVNYFDGTRLVTTAVGTATHILTSNGVGLAPTFQAAASGGITTLAGDSGTATGATVTLAGTTNQITTAAAGSTVTHTIPSTFIAPGTIASTTTITAGTHLRIPTAATTTAGQLQYNGADGYQRFIHAMDGVTTGGSIFAGYESGTTGATGTFNASLGYQCLSSLTSGNRNTAIGTYAMWQLLSGSNNTAIGKPSGAGFPGAGDAFTGSESFNVAICNRGVAGESNVIRLGNSTDQNKCFVAGTYDIAVGATAGVCIIDSAFQVGTISGAAGTVLVGGTKPAWSALSGLAVTAIAGTANQITASASVGSVTLSTPSTFTGPGYIKATTVFNTATATSSTEAQYQINGTAVLHNYGTDNLWVGAGAGTFTAGGSKNVAVGPLAGAALGANAGINNVYVGYKAGTADTGSGSGNDSGNVGIGKEALGAYTGTTNANNTAVGTQSFDQITTGKRNVGLGWEAGHNLTTNDSDNIFVGWSIVGSAGNNNVLRIGGGTGTGSGQQNSCFVSGIQGITVTGTAVLVSGTDQLGIAVSSRRYKDEIAPMLDYSSKILDLEPVTFRYNVGDDRSLQSGLIAEDVAAIMPSLVVNDKEGLPQTIKYHDLPVLLLNELKKAVSEIKRISSELEILKGAR